jgi:cation diffusion facilitator family transporter
MDELAASDIPMTEHEQPRPHHRPPAKPPKGEYSAAILSVGLSVVLLAIKLWAYLLTGSAAIFSDAMENVVNVLASSFTLHSIYLAHRPADSDHPYGHGKIEFLSAGFEGGMILLSACVILWRATIDLISPEAVNHLDAGLYLMTVAMLGNGFAGLFLIRRGRATGSIALEADGEHLVSDAVTSAVAVSALIIVRLTGFRYADPLAAMAVAIYIAWMGARLIRRSAAGLMDKQDAADTLAHEKILDAHLGPAGKEPRICSYHKLRHRHTGRYHWVDFHLVVPGWWDIDKGHRVASAIESELEQTFGEGNATAHVEPCIKADCPLCAISKPG